MVVALCFQVKQGKPYALALRVRIQPGFIKESFENLPPAQKILVLFPDYTRVDFSNMIAPHILDRYDNSHIDFLLIQLQNSILKALHLIQFYHI